VTASSGSYGTASSRRPSLPHKEWTLRVEDILEAIERIEAYTAGLTFESFAADRKTVDAVVRNIEIIGEAVGYVPEEIQRRYPAIPWSRMRGMRNVLIHRYDEVSLPILWQTIQRNLPPLVAPLRAILEE
jgi:uncharacterized protein with HEPN domain